MSVRNINTRTNLQLSQSREQIAPVPMLVGKVLEELLLLGLPEDFSYNQKAVKQIRITW